VIDTTNLFDFAAVRHAYRDLCDVPAGDRTNEQKALHHALGVVVADFKALAAVMDAVKKVSAGKLVPIVTHETLEWPTHPRNTPFGMVDLSGTQLPALVTVYLGSTGVVVLQTNAMLDAMKAMLLGLEVAR